MAFWSTLPFDPGADRYAQANPYMDPRHMRAEGGPNFPWSKYPPSIGKYVRGGTGYGQLMASANMNSMYHNHQPPRNGYAPGGAPMLMEYSPHPFFFGAHDRGGYSPDFEGGQYTTPFLNGPARPATAPARAQNPRKIMSLRRRLDRIGTEIQALQRDVGHGQKYSFFCATCGVKLGRSANFCVNCGHAVPKAANDDQESEPEQGSHGNDRWAEETERAQKHQDKKTLKARDKSVNSAARAGRVTEEVHDQRKRAQEEIGGPKSSARRQLPSSANAHSVDHDRGPSKPRVHESKFRKGGAADYHGETKVRRARVSSPQSPRTDTPSVGETDENDAPLDPRGGSGKRESGAGSPKYSQEEREREREREGLSEREVGGAWVEARHENPHANTVREGGCEEDGDVEELSESPIER